MFRKRKLQRAYESDITQFMREFMKNNPDEVRKQQEGRALWWDREPTALEDVPVQRSLGRAGGAEYLNRVEKDKV